ncbi:MAG TPA: caspase family protein [Bacteroidota bacterium]|nr:caspase family protein [Bacteroidota bacterium]
MKKLILILFLLTGFVVKEAFAFQTRSRAKPLTTQPAESTTKQQPEKTPQEAARTKTGAFGPVGQQETTQPQVQQVQGKRTKAKSFFAMMTYKDAQQKLNELYAQKLALPAEIQKEYEKALRTQVDKSPRGEFETSAMYQERLRREEGKAERLRQEYAQQQQERLDELDRQIKAILDRTFDIFDATASIGKYEADSGYFPVFLTANGQTIEARLFVNLEDARTVKEKFESMEKTIRGAFKHDGGLMLTGLTVKGEKAEYLGAVDLTGSGLSEAVVQAGAAGVSKSGLPPDLKAEISFSEPSGNLALDANETGKFIVKVTNNGQGSAFGFRVDITPSDFPQLDYSAVSYLGEIRPGETKTKEIPIKASLDVASQKVQMTISFTESNGFEPDPFILSFETKEFSPPNLILADEGIEDPNGNGRIEPGEVVKVTVRIQNIGQGPAKDVRATVNLGDNVFGVGEKGPFDLGDLAPGAFKDISFQFYANPKATGTLARVDLTEAMNKYSKTAQPLKLALNQQAKKAQEIMVQARDSRMFNIASGLSIDVEENIPETRYKNPDAVAVVIGISQYQRSDVPAVEFAKRDAELIRQYLVKTLGYDPQNILPKNPDEQMTAGTMKTLIKGQLANYIKKGRSDVFVYFSGHGAPSMANKKAYFVPYDCDPNNVNDFNAYAMEEFYEDLSKLDAKSLTVVVDACFSGQSGGDGKMLIKNASPLALSIESDLPITGNAAVFTASKSDQVANWYNEKKHGMFTYFFTKGLQGAADANKDSVVTVGELEQYLLHPEEGVPYWSLRVHERQQTPQVLARDKNRIIAQY